MKLDSDCVRAVLLAVEESPYDKQPSLQTLVEVLPDYSEQELNYTCLKLEEGGLINAIFATTLREPFPVLVSVTSLTYQGHEFLNSIRDDRAWGKTKDIAKKVGNTSISALARIAQGVAEAAIKAALQLS